MGMSILVPAIQIACVALARCVSKNRRSMREVAATNSDESAKEDVDTSSCPES
jgi:hypothetical protein